MTIFRFRFAVLSVLMVLAFTTVSARARAATVPTSTTLTSISALPQGGEEKKEGEEPAAEAKTEEAAEAENKQEVQDGKALLEPRHKLTEEEIARFEPLLRALLDDPKDPRNHSALGEEVDAFEKAKGYSPLDDPEAWRRIFENRFYESIKKKRVNGAGRVQTDVVLLPVKGELYAFEYAYIIPRSYDHEKRWPVILCLHDKDSDGKTYLGKIWQASNENKALCEGFILVAPDLREKTLEKKWAREGKSVEKRVSWFDINFLRSILLPLTEIRRNYHCDPERIFVEGVGEGADAATELAAIAPGRFAGVINRHGSLRDLNVLKGLEGNKVLMVGRAGGAFYDDKGKATGLLAALEKSRAEQGAVEFELAESPAVDRITSMMMAKQNVDPVIEGNAAIADFVAKTALNPYPVTLRLVSPVTGAFKSHPLVKVTSADTENAENYIDLRMTFDRAKNRIVIAGTSFFELTVFLNDQLLNLEKPIEVIINGVTLDNRTAERSVKAMIGDMTGVPFDYHRVLTAYLKLKVPDEQPAKEAAPAEGEGEKPDEKPAGKTDDDQKK